MHNKWIKIILTVIISSIVMGCSNVLYLSQAISGHIRIMSSRESIEDLLKIDTLDVEIKNKLKLVLDVRGFATEELGLPKNKSYTYVSEIDSQILGWNVYCAPKYSVEPKEWCFPIAGCVIYRGFFNQNKASEYASNMNLQGYDAYISPFTAYSTLGWYNDPVLSSHLTMDSIDLAGLIIHELAHQKVYVKGNSRFNEGFAVAVERAGVLQWLKSTNREKEIDKTLKIWETEDMIVSKILEIRTQLQKLYQSGINSELMESQKDSLFIDLENFICSVNRAGSDTTKIDCKDFEFNNAYLVSIDTYYSLVPTFESILDSLDKDLLQFYNIAEDLSDLKFKERYNKL